MSTRFWITLMVRLTGILVLLSAVFVAIAVPMGQVVPNGAKMAFMSSRQSTWDLFIMDVDRHLIKRFTRDEETNERYPAWSPDGTQLAYHSNRTGRWEIYVASADGREIRQLTGDNIPISLDPYQGIEGNAMVDWSPDGTRLGFHSDLRGDWNLYTINADGSDVRRVTSLSGDEVLFDWSPDGSRILYTSGIEEFMFVTVMDSDGRNRQRLTRLEYVMSPDGVIGTPTGTLEDWHPTWSPDGTRIVFTSNRAGSTDVYVMNVDGTNITQLTNDYYRDYEPVWASNNEIVFVSDRDGLPQIYIMDDTGENIQRLTQMPNGATAPSWLP